MCIRNLLRMQIAEIIFHITQKIPLQLQESWDNNGLLLGDSTRLCTGVLCALDCTEQVVEEAMAKGCNLILVHHPLIFKGISSVTTKNYVGRALLKAAENKIAIYALHTPIDNYGWGVNRKLADLLGLEYPKVLEPKRGVIEKLTVFVPKSHSATLLEALFVAGAGKIGSYEKCSFKVEGTGTYLPIEGSQPFAGKVGVWEQVTEERLEVWFPKYLEGAVLAAMRKAHPYEEVAYFLELTENIWQEAGLGMVGELPKELSVQEFLRFVKETLGLSVIKFTPLADESRKIKKVAVCGGSGSVFTQRVKDLGVDAYITSDYKYHEFFDAEGSVMVCDIGHYESEKHTPELLKQIVEEKFTTFAVRLSETDTNPVRYYY